MNHNVYYDNWFSSVNLLVELEKMGIQCLGNVRPSRLPACSFIRDKEMKRQGRGTVEEKVTSVEGVEMIVLKCYDNKPVHLVSSFAGAYPTSTAQRWDRKEKKSSMSECNHDTQVQGGRGPNGLTYSTVQKKHQVQKMVSSHLLPLLRHCCGEFLAFV